MSNSKAAWLQNTLTELLSSPHISLKKVTGIGIRMGPGPVDLFSTRFNRIFTPDVKAIVAGENVDRDGLKEKLLALQRHYDPDNVKFQAQDPDDRGTTAQGAVHVLLTGTSKLNENYEISVAADVSDTNGQKQMSSLKLDGDPELFTKPTV